MGKVNEPTARALRILLQAAVDNGKYMMIDSIGYTGTEIADAKTTLMMKLFKTKDNKDIHPEIGLKLIQLLNSPSLFKNVNAISRLGNYEGSFNLETLYDMSAQFNDFAKNKDSKLREAAEKLDLDINIEFKKNQDGTYFLHPKEQLAVVLDDTKQSHDIARNTASYNTGPWDISMDLHRNTHIDTINIINTEGIFPKLLKDAAERDGNNSEAHVRESRQQAIVYARDLIRDLKIFSQNRVDFTQVDKADAYNEIKAKFHNKTYTVKENGKDVERPGFAGLSEIAKVYATMMYLGDGALSESSLATTIIPPASSNKSKFNLLDWRTLKEYFKEYNNIILDPELRTFSKKVRKVAVMDYNKIIKEVCSV
jgi:hypothetical protein